MLQIPKFSPEAQYVLAKARPLGPCRKVGEIVPISEIGERRAQQAAEQFLILPTYVEAVKDFTLADGRKLQAGEVVASEELGASILKRYLGLKLRPASKPVVKAGLPGRRKVQ